MTEQEINEIMEEVLHEEYEDINSFNSEQLKEIRLGIEQGIEVSLIASYADPDYSWEEMQKAREHFLKLIEADKKVDELRKLKIYNNSQLYEIREILHMDPNTSLYTELGPEYKNSQMEQIRLGLEYNQKHPDNQIDVSFYTKPEYKDYLMRYLRLGLENGLSLEQISLYNNPEYDSSQIGEIELGLEHNLSIEQVSFYANPEYEADQMYQIRLMLERGYPIENMSLFIDPKYSGFQRNEFIRGIEDGLSLEQISLYANPEYNTSQMKQIRDGLKYFTIEEVSQYANPEYSVEEMIDIKKELSYNFRMAQVPEGYDEQTQKQKIDINELTYKDMLKMSDLELAAYGFISMGDYFDALLKKGKVQWTGSFDKKSSSYYNPYSRNKTTFPAEHVKSSRFLGDSTPVHKIVVTGQHIAKGFYYKGYLSEYLEANTDSYVSRLSTGNYEYYGLVEDEVEKYRKDYDISPQGNENRILYSKIEELRKAINNDLDNNEQITQMAEDILGEKSNYLDEKNKQELLNTIEEALSVGIDFNEIKDIIDDTIKTPEYEYDAGDNINNKDFIEDVIEH